MEDIDWWMWVIIAVVAVLVIGALIAALGRDKSAERRRNEAAELREQALAAQEEVRERETEAAATRAKVEEAKVRADELERRAQAEQKAAADIRDQAQDHLAKADRIDPDFDENSERVVEPVVDRDDGTRSDAPGRHT